MRIVLSESQIFQLLKEAYGKEAYINKLLDKMSGKGMSALSDEERSNLQKLSRGENIDFEDDSEEPQPEQSYATGDDDVLSSGGENQDLFMNLLPHLHKFNIDGEGWHFTKEFDPDHGSDALLVTNEDYSTSFMIIPFADNDQFKVTGAMKEFSFKIKSVPNSPEQMKKFVEEFVNRDLTSIVKYIKKKQ